MKNHLYGIIVAALTFAGALYAQAETDTASSPIIAENLNLRNRSPITLTAKDASLSEIMRVLAERSGMNFVAGEGVHREKITLILNKTPLDEAINLLVRAAGLSYEVIGNSVLIAEADRLKEEVGLSSYVVELKYAQASEVAEMLKDLTKNVKVDEGGNRLVCYTSPRVILEIERIVKAIDHPHILVLLETRLIEVSMEKLDLYGIKWSELTPVTSGVTYPQSPISDGFQAGKWIKAAVNIDLKLDLLLQNGDARMLMNSKITTTNNREAKLHIGEIVPYTVQSYNMGGAGGAGGNLQIMKENVGVIITMTPHVNDANQITLNLFPEVSSISAWKGQHGDIPLVRTRKANTTVRVENGQKVFLAGLLSEEKTLTVHKVPVLGDIPIFGLLFQNRKEEIKKNNLIIEVIPRIINNPGDIAKVLEATDGDSAAISVQPSSAPAGVRTPAAPRQQPAPKSSTPPSSEAPVRSQNDTSFGTWPTDSTVSTNSSTTSTGGASSEPFPAKTGTTSPPNRQR